MATDWYRIGRQGAQGELLAAIDLMDRGFEVFRAVDPVASTDFIAHSKGEYWRVQVKTGNPAVTKTEDHKQEIVAWVDLSLRQITYEPGPPYTTAPLPEPNFGKLSDTDRARIDAIAMANRMDGHVSWFATLHCENKTGRYSCDVRDCEIRVKEYPNDPPAVRGPFVCPACGKPAKLLHVQTARDWNEAQEWEARRSVNEQLWNARDLQKHPDMALFPRTFSELTDYQLPGWTECESPLVES